MSDNSGPFDRGKVLSDLLTQLLEQRIFPANAAVAVVTGANRGIGLEVARQLATRGHIVVLGSRDLSKGQAVADRLAQQGIEVVPRRLDVTKQDTIDALVGELSAVYGRLAF